MEETILQLTIRLWCKIFGHDVELTKHHEIWEYYWPEIDEQYWCKRCGRDL